MPLPSPPPELTPTMEFWGDLKSNPDLLQRTIDLLNNSPTAREQIWHYEARIGVGAPSERTHGIVSPNGNVASYDNAANQIAVGKDVITPEDIAGSIAHELGHYIDDANLDKAAEWGCNPSYIGARVMTSLASEGIAAINNYRIYDEIKTHSGHEIGFYPSRDDEDPAASTVFEVAQQAAQGYDFRSPEAQGVRARFFSARSHPSLAVRRRIANDGWFTAYREGATPMNAPRNSVQQKPSSRINASRTCSEATLARRPATRSFPAQEFLGRDAGLFEDRSQRAFRHVPGVIGNRGVAVRRGVEPDFMRAARLAVKLHA